MERCDVITRSNPRPAQADDERILDEVFELLMVLMISPRGALFCRSLDGGIALAASRGVDQLALDLASAEWGRAGGAADGEPWYGQGSERSYMLLPCVDDGAPAGVLYAEVAGNSRRVPAAHLETFSGLLGRALRARAGLGEPAQEAPAPVTQAPDVARENLVLQLERHEWNVSRVARVLGVTRMTVYNRMRRLGVPRQRVRKTAARRAR